MKNLSILRRNTVMSLPISEKKGGCGCGHHNETPTLDARDLSPAIRHGAIGQLQSGSSMDLIAPHNPLPLLEQVYELFGASVEITYVSEDPWTLNFAKS
ncbi:DUF2249 domain-containing protein [Corynebacterium diphtheriae bv. mitis]|nr:DUF2249 domain-containing protein [Corynebacterium diphtheriae bv. mitis]MBG9362104.1 DUF2249 domain-containing protein [Corynebacterium diphtheriae bv. mitis]MBG9364254.1 DUF2249 domain-containing protein [Corynebacterium diphtheriae bv. mitis]MBG9366452.1 DUF2249 domain-containing protein [Corynebacterium diphtheriae bv. mitis]